MTDRTETLKTIKASILTIGTELTTGQIVNTHSAWISGKLVLMGFDVVLHETVADDRPLIFQALQRCASASDLIFVCGGLGPTTDDFTRDVVAQWAGLPLEFDEASWQYISDRLASFGVPLVPSQKQQCFFPKGSTILFNSQGTAHGFSLGCLKTKKLWVFPGPPREVHAVWDAHMDRELAPLAPPQTPLTLFTWKCAGKSEAELGEITEAALKGSGYTTGYRASFPYVEVKVWCPTPSTEPERAPWFDRLEKGLAPYVITKQGQDMGALFLDRLLRHASNIQIIDAATGGALADRLGTLMRKRDLEKPMPTLTIDTRWGDTTNAVDTITRELARAKAEQMTLALAGSIGDSFCIGMHGTAATGTANLQAKVSLPYRGKFTEALLERRARLVPELAMKQWYDWLAH